jgi:two-component system sensor histidine kinase/response regulator
MKKYFVIFVIIILSFFNKVGVAASSEDSRLDSLYQLAFEGLDFDINSSLKVARLLISQSKAKNDSLNLAYAYDVYGLALFYSNDFDSALSYADKSIYLFDLLEHKEGLSTAIYNKSVVYEYLGRYNSAIELLNRARKIDINRGEIKESDIFYYHSLAEILSSQDRNEEALVYSHLSLSAFLREESGHDYMEPRIYITLGWLYLEEEIFEMAKYYAKKAYYLSSGTKQLALLISSLEILALNAQSENNQTEAVIYARKALSYAKDYKEITEIIYAKSLLAKILFSFEKDNIEAKEYWIEVDSAVVSFEYFEKDLKVIHELYTYYKVTGNFERANFFLEEYANLKRDLNSVDAFQALANFENDLAEGEAKAIKTRLESEENDNRFKSLVIIGIGILFSMVLVAFLMSLYSQKKIIALNDSLNDSHQSILDKELELRKSFGTLEEKYEEIKGLNASKNRLLSILSHDLRQPFNQILAVLDLIDQDILSFEERRGIVHELKISVEETSSMVNNLLQWSKSQFEGRKMKPQVLNLEIIAKRVSLELSVLLKKKSIHLDFKVDEFLHLRADEVQFASIIRNVLSNAYKFSEEKSTIKVCGDVSKDEKYSLLRIEDTGIGMTKEQLSSVLNNKGQLSMPGTNNELGTGIGMMIVQEFVDQNNGYMQVESELGKGTTFTVALPRVENIKSKFTSRLA